MANGKWNRSLEVLRAIKFDLSVMPSMVKISNNCYIPKTLFVGVTQGRHCIAFH